MIPTASRYLRAADRKAGDPTAIFEAAIDDGLDAETLAKLAGRLRGTHPKWRPAKRLRDPIINGLLDAGVTPARIAAELGCDRKTVYRRAEERAAACEGGPANGINKPSECPKTGGRDDGWPTCSCGTRGARSTPAQSDPDRCLTCGCRFEWTGGVER